MKKTLRQGIFRSVPSDLPDFRSPSQFEAKRLRKVQPIAVLVLDAGAL